MLRTMSKSKIHRVTVTQADLHYTGSLTVEEDLMDAADLLPAARVSVVDVTNGARLETYVVPGARGSHTQSMNGAAAHLVGVGDLVIVISYALMTVAEARRVKRIVVHVDKTNAIVLVGSDAGVGVPELVLDPDDVIHV